MIKCNLALKSDLSTSCAGLAFNIKAPVFEQNIENSKILNKEEIDRRIPNIKIKNIIVVPLFDENNNSIGVFEALNCVESAFNDSKMKDHLTKYAKYISLLFYTSNLLRVFLIDRKSVV